MYGIHVTVAGSVEAAEQKVIAALKDEGFGVLTEIDVKAVMKNKLNIDRKPYKILGACNPVLANQVLAIEPDAGLLLPCNVVIQEEQDGSTTVALIDPEAMFTVINKPAIADIVKDVKSRFQRVAAAIEA